MDVLVKIAQLLLSLSLLIVLHEMGHFLIARLFKVRVEKFYLFFDAGFSLFKRKIGDTEYGIGWLPLGGYVKISGMIDESMDREQMKQEPQPWEFRSKKAWQRLLIMLGGVLVNFVLALLIYILVFFRWGEEYVPVENLTDGYMFEQAYLDLGFEQGDKVLAVEGREIRKWTTIHHDIVVNDDALVTIERMGRVMDLQIPEGSTAKLLKQEYVMEPRIPCEILELGADGNMIQAGFKADDRIIAVDDQPIAFYDEFKSLTRSKTSTAFDLTVLREGDTLVISTVTNEEGMFGFSRKLYLHFYEPVTVRYTFLQSVPAGVRRGFEISSSYVKQLGMLFKPETKAYEELGGFIKIGSIFPSTWDWERFWNMTAFLSIILAIMNVLPIPALDGGHVMFTLFEMITGRKPGDKFLEYAQVVGMVLLLALLLYANLNDIIGLFR